MPEPTPTTDTKTGKKPNKTVLILGAAGVAVLIFILYKSKKAKEESQIPYTSQAFIPVTGENVAGAGASPPFGGGGIGGGVGGVETQGLLSQAQKENTELITNFLREEQESRREESKLRSEESKQPINVNITGGGAPSSGQIGSGAGTGGGGSGATTTSKPTSPVASYKTIKCPNGCTGHEYPKGHSGHGSREVDCQQGEARRGNCHW